MKTKSKLIGIVLLCCLLVFAFTACAGCTEKAQNDNVPTVSPTNNPSTQIVDMSNDPVVGSYILTPELVSDYHVVREIYPDGTYSDTWVFYEDGSIDVDGPFTWVKIDDTNYDFNNKYGKGSTYTLTDDGKQLYSTFTISDKILTNTFRRIYDPESYKKSPVEPNIPGSSLGSSEPVVGTWKYDAGQDGNLNRFFEFRADGSLINTFVYSSDNVDKITDMWVKIGGKDNQYQSSSGYYKFSLSPDGTQLICTTTTSEKVFYKASSNEVPAEK